jgi:hypothetical protein
MLFEKLFHFFALAPSGCETKFIGFNPWYHYLPAGDFGNGVPKCDLNSNFSHNLLGNHTDVLLILVAVVDDLLQLAGLVALAFVIVGAIKFITSEGNSEAATNARSTIINALAGLAISLIAIVLVNFIGTQVGR